MIAREDVVMVVVEVATTIATAILAINACGSKEPDEARVGGRCEIAQVALPYNTCVQVPCDGPSSS